MRRRQLKVDVREEHNLEVHWVSSTPGVVSLMLDDGGSVELIPRREDVVPVMGIGNGGGGDGSPAEIM